jgi:hypothetical protein
MVSRRRTIALSVLSILLATVATQAGCLGTGHEVPPVFANDEPVTFENLYWREALWPHHIQLTDDWKPRDWDGHFGWGQGVLLRVRRDGALRVDFGHYGPHWVPASETDVLDRAERLRLGQDTKFDRNLALVFGSRLLDPSETRLKRSQLRVGSFERAIVVFADPEQSSFAELTSALIQRPLDEDAVLILVALGDHRDRAVFYAAHEANWPGVFLQDTYTASFGDGYLEDPAGAPVVRAFSMEGRLISEWRFGEHVLAELDRVLAAR